MKRLHLIVGLATLAVFVLTGQYMDKFHEHLLHTPDAPRLLFRSRHIYLLMAGLVNISLGLYLARQAAGWRRHAQTVGSGLLLLAPALLLYAFFTEPFRQGWEQPASFFGVVAAFAGMLPHLFGAGFKRED
jgi:hypothetical protein